MKNIRHKLCRDKIFSYCDTNYCNLEKLVETLYEEVCCDKVINVMTLKEKVSDPHREPKS